MQTPKTAFIVEYFPAISETFILRELIALREKGVLIEVFALKRGERQFVHKEEQALTDGVIYRPRRLRLFCGLFYFFLRRPIFVGGHIFFQLADCQMILCPGRLLRRLYHGATALYFVRHAERLNIRRVHAQFATVPCDIGLMMSRAGGWGFSFSGHARDIYTQRVGELARKIAAAGFVSVCTEKAQRYLQETFPGNAEKIRLIRHGLFPEEFPADEKPAGTGGSNRILYVGRLTAKKGVLDLVAACGILKSRGITFRCDLIGDGPLREQVAMQIEAQSCRDVVHQHGVRTLPEVRSFHRESSVFVLPSVTTVDRDQDGISNAVLEAMASSLPVVTTYDSAACEVITSGRNGILLSGGAPVKLADCLAELLANPTRCVEMGTAARKTVKDMFDIRKNVEQYIRLFGSSFILCLVSRICG